MIRDSAWGLELRHLRALVAVADSRSFSRAADDLGYAQSAVSQQIAALERIVTTQLVERPGGPRPVRLTQAGELLARHAVRILADVALARADLDALTSGEGGTLRIGVFQSAGARILPDALRRFRRQLPRVVIRLEEDQDDERLVTRILHGELDVAFVEVPLDDPRIATVELLHDDWVLLAPPESPLIDHQPVAFASLDGLAMLSWSVGAPARSVRAYLDRLDVHPDTVFTTDDNLTLQRLVGAGLGHAIVPTLAVEDRGVGVTTRLLTLQEGIPPRRVGLAWVRDRALPRAVEHFVAAARAVTADSSRRSPRR